MGDFKLRVSDIFRYMVLGAAQVGLAFLVLVENNLDINLETIDLFGKEPLVTMVIALSIFYLCGFFTQMILMLFCRENLMGCGLGEVACFINSFPSHLLNRGRYPHWLYYTKRPRQLLNIYKEIMETSPEADMKTQYLYASNLFQGLAISLVAFAVFYFCHSFGSVPALVATLAVAVLCVCGYCATKSKLMLLLNKSLMIAVPLAIFLAFWLGQSSPMDGLAISLSVLVCLAIAEGLVRQHIRRVDTLIKYSDMGEKESKFMKTLKRIGIPRAFVLTRVDDSALPYLTEQLESIQVQTYPNIKVLVLIDCKSQKRAEIIEVIEKYRASGLPVSHFTSQGSGPAMLAYEIRDIFIDFSSDDDIAISLDADDLFASPETVTRIVGRMARTQANICLITFETFGDTSLNFAKNYPNEQVREIACQATENGRALTSAYLLKNKKPHLISTIGWTKCYRKKILRQYNRLWDKYKYALIENTKYEDFPDIVAVMGADSRICAVGRTTVLFRKHPGSVTTAVNKENYLTHITYFLRMSARLAEDANLPTEVVEMIRNRFIPYKFIQYLNIVLKKTTGEKPELPGFSTLEFYDNFVEKVYNGNYNELLQGMIEVLDENAGLLQEDHAGYYGHDLPHALRKNGNTMDEIRDAYGLKK